MKAFLASLVVCIVIAVAAHFVLGSLGMSSQSVFSTDNVRIDG